MTVTNCTITGYLAVPQSDWADIGSDSDMAPLTGTVSLRPVTEDRKPLAVAPDYDPPAVFAQPVMAFTGYVEDGVLKTVKGGDPGLRVPANDPVLGLDRIWYRIDFDLATGAGQKVVIEPQYFEAPSTDTSVDLSNILTETGSTVSGVVRQAGYAEDILDGGSVGRELVRADTRAEARNELGLPDIVHAADTIVADGVTDVSDALGALIAGLPNGSVLQLDGGDYYAPTLRDVAVDTDITIKGVPGKTRIIGDGVLTPSNRDADVMLNLTSGSIRLEDIVFEDAGVVLAFKDLSELGDIEIYRCEFRGVGSPLMVRYDPATAETRIAAGKTMSFDNLRVRDCQVVGCALGIWLQHDGGWNSVSITDNVFEDIGQAGVWVGYEYTANVPGGVVALNRSQWQPRQGRVVVANNVFRDIHRSSYTLSNPGANAIVVEGQQAVISGNHIEDVTSTVWDDCEGIYTKARYVQIHDNVLVNAGGSEAAIICKGPAWDASTTIAAGSNGQTLPQSTINVASTEGFGPPFGAYSSAGGSGNIILIQTSAGWQSVTFTSKTATQLLGCSGGTGTLTTGAAVRGNANLFGGLGPVSTPNTIHHNTIVFTRTDVLQRGISNVLGGCTISDNLIVGATNQAINAYATSLIVNNVIRDHHGTTAISVGGTDSGGGSVVRGNAIINLDGSYAPAASPYIAIGVFSSSGTEYRDIQIVDNVIRNELTAAGALSAASQKLRAVNVNASGGTVNGLTVRGNKARNVLIGINISSLGTVTNFHDIDNDWKNEAGSAPVSITTFPTVKSFRPIDFSGAVGVGSLDLGGATDTTLTRSAAGQLAVEGVNVLMNGGPLGTPSSATLTNATGLPVAGVSDSGSTGRDLVRSATKAAARSALGLPVTVHAADSITSDGVTDVSTALGTLIANLPNGGVLQLDGCDYYAPALRNVLVDTDITIKGVPGKTRIVGDGTLKSTLYGSNSASSDVMLKLIAGGSIRVEDVTVEDAGIFLGLENLNEVSDIELHRCKFVNSGGVAFMVNSDASFFAGLAAERLLTWRNLRMTDCDVVGCELGLLLNSLGGWESATVSGCTFTDVGMAGVWIGAEGGVSGSDVRDPDIYQRAQSGVHVYGNTFRTIRRTNYTTSTDVESVNAIAVWGYGVHIHDNHIEDVDITTKWDDCEGIYCKAQFFDIHNNTLIDAGGAEAAINMKGGTWEASTTLHSSMNGLSLPQSTLTVASTAGFPGNYTEGGSVRKALVETNSGWQAITWTGKTATTLTGVTGGTGTLSTGGEVRGSAHQSGYLEGKGYPGQCRNNTIIFTKTDKAYNGINVGVPNAAITGNVIKGCTNRAVGMLFWCTNGLIADNYILDHHGINVFNLSASGWVVRNNTVINLDGSYAGSSVLRVFWVYADDNTSISNIQIRDNYIWNPLSENGTLAAPATYVRVVNLTGVTAGLGAMDNISIVNNVARNVGNGVVVSSGVTCTNLTDVFNDWRNLAGSQPTNSTSNASGVIQKRIDELVTVNEQQTLTDKTFVGPILGTPVSGNLANCTGLPLAGVVSSASTALGVGSLEVGHETDTTVTRVEAGRIAVEGKTLLDTDDAAGEPLSSGESTMMRRNVTSASASTTNGVLRLTYFTARRTETITQVRTISGGTASVGATLARIGIYEEASNGDLTLVASVANDTALWSSGSTAYTKSFSASFTKTRGKRYALGILVVGTSTAPTLYGHAALLGSEGFVTPRVSASATAAQTDLPASLASSALSASSHQHYAALLP